MLLRRKKGKDVTVTPETVTMSVRAIDPAVSIEERITEQGRVMQLLVQHVNEDREGLEEAKKERGEDRKENRKWRWMTLAVAIIAILISIGFGILH